jgi:type I restriction enzyme, S subunit
MNAQFEAYPKKPLGALFDLEYGAALPSTSRSGVGYPVFRSNGMVGRHSSYLVEGPGIMVGRKGSVGQLCWSDEPFWPIDTAYYVTPKEHNSLRWLYWVLSSLNLKSLDAATGVPGLNRNDVYAVEVHRPGSIEQSRIAAVLDTVDEAIVKTEAVVVKLKQVRSGLLYDLLTRGIDENGQLRDPLAHPQQFKKSPMGRIPKGWRCSTLLDIADWFSGGTPNRSQTSLWQGDIPFLTPKDMKTFKLSDTMEHVTEETIRGGSRLMPPNTVFVVVRGMILAHTFPVCFSAKSFSFNQDIKAVRGREDVNAQFLAYWFLANSNLFLRKTTEATHGTKKLETGELYRILIAIPCAEEQQAIVDRIEAMDGRITAEAAGCIKLLKMKSGLMNDLLTGRVRVPDDLIFTKFS